MKEEKSAGDRYKIILSLVLVLLLFISVIGITYALFSYSKEGQVKNIVRAGESITFSYTETSNGISLVNAMPVSDKVGKTLDRSENNNGYFDFNVSAKLANSDNVQYEIYALKQEVENELDEKYVKVYLTDGTTDTALDGYNTEVPTYNTLKKSITVENGKQLYFGTFSNSGVQTFRLRMWVSDKYTVTANSEQFKIKVNVKASGN